jgi:hypothetical protein
MTIDEYFAAKALAEKAIAVAKTAKTALTATNPERKNPLFTIKLPDRATKDVESSEHRLLNH